MSRDSEPSSRVLEHIYEVALDPTSYERLLDYWEEMIRPALADEEVPAKQHRNLDGLTHHFERAERMLGAAEHMPLEEGAEDAVAKAQHTASFTIGMGATLISANMAATSAFGITSGARAEDLPFADGEVERLLTECRGLIRRNRAAGGIICLRTADTHRLVVIHTRLYRPTREPAFVLCMTSEIGWPTGFADMVKASFGLSNAEVEVMRHLAEGYHIKDIAARRSRSIETVRAQVKAVIRKTGAANQVELIKIALSTIEILQSASGATEEGDGDRYHRPLATKRVFLIGGRYMDYVTYGDPKGSPVLFLPLNYGFIHWPEEMMAEATRRKLKIIAPIRAGYGNSSPVGARSGYLDTLTQDHLTLMDQMAINRAALVSMGGDSLLAMRLAAGAPERFTALYCCSGTMPPSRREQYERMDKWHRFILAGARYTPQLLPFMVKAGFALARKWGKHNFIATVYAESPADTATFKIPNVRDALLTGSDVTLSDEHSAYDAFTRELVAYERDDWTQPLATLSKAAECGALAIHFYSGQQDPQVCPETLSEFQQDYPWINFHVYPDAGQLLFFLKWRDVLAQVARDVAAM